MEYRVHVGALIATFLFLNPPVLPSDTRGGVCDRELKDGRLQHLWLRKWTTETRWKTTTKKKGPRGRKRETTKPKEKKTKKKTELRKEWSNCEPWERRFSRCVFFFFFTGFGRGAGRRAPHKNLQLTRLTWRLTRWHSNKPAAVLLYYIQLSVNPMTDQAVHPEEKH